MAWDHSQDGSRSLTGWLQITHRMAPDHTQDGSRSPLEEVGVGESSKMEIFWFGNHWMRFAWICMKLRQNTEKYGPFWMTKSFLWISIRKGVKSGSSDFTLSKNSFVWPVDAKKWVKSPLWCWGRYQRYYFWTLHTYPYHLKLNQIRPKTAVFRGPGRHFVARRGSRQE